jgi:sugar phosphate isomerase/epimerase
MELEIYRQLWGVTTPLGRALPRFKDEGFSGVEHELPAAGESAELRQALVTAGLHSIPLVGSHGDTFDEHLVSLTEQVRRAAEYEPRLITCHTGADRWPIADALAILEHALALEADVGIPLAHETHRTRVLFSPWQTLELLRRLPGLKLCCDYSHWVVVAERLLDDEVDVLDACAERCIHIHARVGYQEGPQVPDPAAPEYRSELLAHERWWDQIWASQETREMQVVTLTPEYGPPDYLHTLPYTRVPVADLWSISTWQAARERERFARRGSGA